MARKALLFALFEIVKSKVEKKKTQNFHTFEKLRWYMDKKNSSKSI